MHPKTRIKQLLIFVSLAVPILAWWNTQPTTRNEQPKLKAWEIVFGQPFEMALPFSEGLAAIQAGGKYGYIDKTGRVLIKPQLDGAENFCEGMALVTMNYKKGYINKAGEIVAKPQFEYANPFSEGLALVDFGNMRAGYIDNTGKVGIKAKFE